MPDYRRWYEPGGTYFFTVVTYSRHRFFDRPLSRRLLRQAMRSVAEEMPWETIAIVLLYDHLHVLWTLPPGDGDFSGRWQQIKTQFTQEWLAAGGEEVPVTPAQAARGHRGVWHKRFWEHLIRDEDDLSNHCDYIHYNPVKHGYVKRPWDWPHSSFRRLVAVGHYP
ncbi:MAG: transposase, partial [Acidobacteriota bacterium]